MHEGGNGRTSSGRSPTPGRYFRPGSFLGGGGMAIQNCARMLAARPCPARRAGATAPAAPGPAQRKRPGGFPPGRRIA